MHSISQLSAKIAHFEAQNLFPAKLPELYEPCTYILGLGGKRLRPALVLMGCDMMGQQDMDTALPAAWAVELFHNFSLVHDDIMDAAPLRRGQPTVHEKWSQTTGILSGDVMLIYAYRFLAQHPDPAVVKKLIVTFNRVATEVCEGQQMDMNFEGMAAAQVTGAAYIDMIELKTAVLLGGALELGAICAGASAEDCAHIYQVGRCAGIAFQIQDDYLDTFGDPGKFGKQVGGDILQNKKTLLVLQALELASVADKKALLAWMGDTNSEPKAKIAAVKAIFERCGVPEHMESAKAHFQQTAFEHLASIQVPEGRKSILKSFLEDLLIREH
jgi:geranylgeranyl diphosphate synthase, type II